MAIYHLHVSIISRSSGRSAVAAAAYRAAEKLHSEHDRATHDFSQKSNAVNAAAYRSGEQLHNTQHGTIYDYTNKRGVVYSEIMLPDHAPKEYNDRTTLWNAVERAEKRCDAQTAREINMALPVELDKQEQIGLMRDYIKNNFVDKGMAADFAIHDKRDNKGHRPNPHAHIMLTTREVSWAGFGKKNRDWNKVELLGQWREKWADICNREFERKGLHERIDHRTLAAQGITREPTIHHGYSFTLKAKNDEIIKRNKEYIYELKDGCVLLEKKIKELHAEQNGKERELLRINTTIQDISYRKEQIDELRQISQNNKDNILLAHSYIQAHDYFVREYKIPPDKAQAVIKRLQAQTETISRELENIDIKPYSELLEKMEREHDRNDTSRTRGNINMRTHEERDTNPDYIAAYMHELKLNYTSLNREYSAHQQKGNNIQREMKYLTERAKEITDRAVDILRMREQLDELNTQRQKMGIFASKKDIDEQISGVEFLYNNTTAYFRQHYNITIGEAAAEVKRIEQQLRENERTQKQERDRLPTIDAYKEQIMREYQHQRLLADTRPDGADIQYKLTQLSDKTILQCQSSQDKLIWVRCEHDLDMVRERNFEKLADDMPEEQIKALVKRRERREILNYALGCDDKREHERGRERSRAR